MNLSYSDHEERFRQELRRWLSEHLPDGWSTGNRRLPPDHAEEDAFLIAWAQELSTSGWAGITWPQDYGGRAASLIEEVIYDEEMAACEAPPFVNLVGARLVGPTLIALGTPEQKTRHLPRILRGEEFWCQGYSEPNAGSDLAAIKTRAMRAPRGFVVNGQKTWTSFAHCADRCFLLARTGQGARKHDGITALLVNMRQPGVTVRPIQQANGARRFSEVTFTDVRVADDDVVGEVDRGWEVALTLLGFERAMLSSQVFALRTSVQRLLTLAIQRRDEPTRPDDVVTRALVTAHWIRARAALLLFYRHLSEQMRNGPRGAEGSLDKLIVTEHHKEVAAFGMSLLGVRSALWEDDQDGRVATWRHVWLTSVGYTLAGGTSEVMRNIVGERLLGLPRDLR